MEFQKILEQHSLNICTYLLHEAIADNVVVLDELLKACRIGCLTERLYLASIFNDRTQIAVLGFSR